MTAGRGLRPDPHGEHGKAARIEVVAVAGLSTVQDGGRPGRMHEGVPPGGALVPELLARANAAVRNAPGEAGIEVFGSLTLKVLASGDVHVSRDDGAAHALRAGETWTIASRGGRVAYAAVRGGIDVPVVLGGRGTLLVAGLGGHEGRALRKSDVLPVGLRNAVDAPAPSVLPAPDAAVRILAGPDGERFPPAAIDRLVTAEFRVSPRSDRTGVRLGGPPLPRADDDRAASAPMVRGAIQVPGSGELIVLGPDHPTTGGYPVVATVVRADLGGLMARPVGATVRFARMR
jgi:biotin-dependent carboxylase-like uncharacterized protein